MAELEEGEILDSENEEENLPTCNEIKKEPTFTEVMGIKKEPNFTEVMEIKKEETDIEVEHSGIKTEVKEETAEFKFHESNLFNIRDKASSQGNSLQFSMRRSPEKPYNKAQGRPLFKYSDEESATSDEDTDLWKCKKARYFSNTKEKSMELSEEIKSPVRNGGTKKPGNSVTKGRKLNNIWGSVLVEQDVTHIFSNVGVEKNPEVDRSDRNVETYDFTKAYEDIERPYEPGALPDFENSDGHDPFNKVIESHDITALEKEGVNANPNLKRKRISAKERIKDFSEWTYDDTKNRDHFGVTVGDSDAKIVNAISNMLNEPKIDLISKVVQILGSKKALETAYLTEDVEDAGGMMTFDGYRRRTPGGVYIQLLKKDKEVSKTQYTDIFGEEERLYKKAQRKQQRERRKEVRQLYNSLPQSKFCHWENRRGQQGEKMDDDSNFKNKKKHKKHKKRKEKRDVEMKDSDHSSGEEENVENEMDNETGEVNLSSKNEDSFEQDLDFNAEDDILIG